MSIVVVGLTSLAAAPAAQAATPTPPFNQCPAAGTSTSCAFLIWFDPTGHIQILADPSQSGFDGASGDADDDLVGVQNDSGTTVSSVTIGAVDDFGDGAFGFDGDGACSGETPPVPADCPVGGATGYEGPITTFSGFSTDQAVSTGTVTFTGGLASGAGTWFSIEGVPTLDQIAINPPIVIIDSPDFDEYTQGEVADAADYTCQPGVGATLQSCVGDVPNGTPVDTSVPGDHTFSVTATDTDGNSVTRTAEYFVFAAPTATITTPPDGAVYTHDQVVIADYSCTVDPNLDLEGCDGNVPNGSPIDTSTAGSFTFTVTATDDFPATATAISHYTVLAAPPTAMITTPADNATYTHNQAVNASYACTPGAGGGVLQSCAGAVANGSPIDTSTAGKFTFKVTATDTDNQTDVKTFTYNVLAGPPTATITTPADNATYAHNQAVNASYACTPGAGGGVLQSCAGPVANGSPIDTSTAGTFTFKVTATDTDTQSGMKTVTYNVLAGPPTATITTPADNATYGHNQVVNASYACTPGAGGGVIQSCGGPVANGSPIDTSTLGPHTFKVTATDTDTQTGFATNSYTVVAAANLSLTKTSAPNPVIAGQQLTYTLTVHNAGPDAAANPKIVDTLPAGAVFQKEGTGAGSASCTAAGQTVTCLPATIPAGQDGTVTIVVLPAAGPVVNTATVSSTTFDPDLTNNTATNTTTAATSCTQAITTPVSGHLEAMSGQFICVSGTTVTGSISVDAGGALTLTNATVSGSVQTQSAQFVTICGSHLGSSPVLISNTSLLVRLGDDDSACAPNTIGGAVKVDTSHGGVEVYGNTIGGSLTLTNNLGASPVADGIPEAEANHITGTLSCSGNSPAPIDDNSPNTTGGAKLGQCVNL